MQSHDTCACKLSDLKVVMLLHPTPTRSEFESFTQRLDMMDLWHFVVILPLIVPSHLLCFGMLAA